METTEQQSQKSTQFQFLKVEMKINKKTSFTQNYEFSLVESCIT